jgi:hypothetical protein
LLGALVLCNLAILPVHHAYSQSRYLGLSRLVTPEVLQGLRDLHRGHLTDRPAAVDPVYQFFRARMSPTPERAREPLLPPIP